MGPAAKMHAHITGLAKSVLEGNAVTDETSVEEAMDVLVRWFCILFGNQFSPDDVFDHYPVDRLIHDITFAMMAVQAQATAVLSEFPIPAAQETKAS
jgi:hypothetical protein